MATKKKKKVATRKSSTAIQRTEPATMADLTIKTPKQIRIDDANLTPEEYQVASAVREFHIAGRTLEMFMAENQRVMMTYTAFVDEYNQKLDAATNLVRALGVTIDEFTSAGQPVTYDAEGLFRRIGKDKFQQIGGSVEQQPVYEIPRDKIETAAALHIITPDDVLAVRSVGSKYHMPKPR